VHAAGPEGAGPQQPPATVTDHGVLDRVLLLLAGDERPVGAGNPVTAVDLMFSPGPGWGK
jgi:hypothetical protein